MTASPRRTVRVQNARSASRRSETARLPERELGLSRHLMRAQITAPTGGPQGIWVASVNPRAWVEGAPDGLRRAAMQQRRDEITRLIGEIEAHIRAAEEQVGAGTEGE